MDSAAVVVPVYVHAKVALSVPVNRAFVVFVENFCETVGLLLCSLYLIRKSSTQRVNEIGRQLCFQRPGVTLLCW